VKLFQGDSVWGVPSLVSPGAPWIGLAGGVNNNAGPYDGIGLPHIDMGPNPGNSGFYSAVYNALGGVANGSSYEFNFKWITNAAPILDPSIKAVTVDIVDVYKKIQGVNTFLGQTDDKSRQWSSGPLGGTPVPEPGTIALVALGAVGYLVARRRKRL